MAYAGAGGRIIAAVSGWGNVESEPHRFGGTAFRIGRREIGHIHGDSTVDIPFPMPVRNELVESGAVIPHRVVPKSGWITFIIRSEEDVERAIALFHRSYTIATEQKRTEPGGIETME